MLSDPNAVLYRKLRRRPDIAAAGGEQAANIPQLDSSNRHATTADAKVRGPIEASLLVTRRPCLFHTTEANAAM
jgi:hypothetical protein